MTKATVSSRDNHLCHWTTEQISHIFDQPSRVWFDSVVPKIRKKWFSCNTNSLTDYLSVVWFYLTLISDRYCATFCREVKGEWGCIFQLSNSITLCHLKPEWLADWFSPEKSMDSYSSSSGRCCWVVLRNCSPQNWNSVIIYSAWCQSNLQWSLYSHQTHG